MPSRLLALRSPPHPSLRMSALEVKSEHFPVVIGEARMIVGRVSTGFRKGVGLAILWCCRRALLYLDLRPFW